MNSDLRRETGSPHPGVDRLFRTLTAGGTAAELAGEHDALAMFRANVRPPAGPAAAPAGPATAPAGPATAPAGSWRSARILRFPVRWSVRLAAVAAAVAVGGTAAAAYAAVLPDPVQHLAHSVLGFAGVPDRQGGSAQDTSGRYGRSRSPPAQSGCGPVDAGHDAVRFAGRRYRHRVPDAGRRRAPAVAHGRYRAHHRWRRGCHRRPADAIGPWGGRRDRHAGRAAGRA